MMIETYQRYKRHGEGYEDGRDEKKRYPGIAHAT